MQAKIISAKHLDSLEAWVRANGNKVPSVRGDTYEILGVHLILRNPRNRLDTNTWRKLNFPFAVAEFLQLLDGNSDIGFLTPFNSKMLEYSSDGKQLDGAYGPRIHTGGHNRVEEVIEMLTKDPESRRAVISIFQPGDTLGEGLRNTPCTLSVHFLVRDDSLYMMTHMRSNDIHYGLSNDIVSFTMLQEYVAGRLGLKLGEYHHLANSFHFYEDIAKTMQKRKDKAEPETIWPLLMRPMEHVLEDKLELARLISCYYIAGSNSVHAMLSRESTLQTQYARDLANAAFLFTQRKTTHAAFFYTQIKDPTVRRMMRPWMSK